MSSRCVVLILFALVTFVFARNATYIEVGRPTKISKYPSQVSVNLKDMGHICGGTLVGRRWALSAAHCYYSNEFPVTSYTIRAGSSRSNKGGVIAAVKKIIMHKKYDPVTMDYDIALLKMRRGYGDIIRKEYPIDFARLSNQLPLYRSSASLTGWGSLHGGGYFVERLHMARVEIIPTDYCNTTTYNAGAIMTTMFCAGYSQESIDACQADSGGPLYIGNEVIGIASWGLGCSISKSPGVYTNVAFFNKWIRDIMNSF